jgi:hypothetical protein
MAQITEAKLFEWLGRLYAERNSIAEERDEARRVAVQLTEQLQAAEAKKGSRKSPTT